MYVWDIFLFFGTQFLAIVIIRLFSTFFGRYSIVFLRYFSMVFLALMILCDFCWVEGGFGVRGPANKRFTK